LPPEEDANLELVMIIDSHNYLGNFQKVSKEEAIAWFKQKYEGLVLN